MGQRLTLIRRIHMNKSLMATAIALAFRSSAALANPTNNATTVTLNPPATTQSQPTTQAADSTQVPVGKCCLPADGAR